MYHRKNWLWVSTTLPPLPVAARTQEEGEGGGGTTEAVATCFVFFDQDEVVAAGCAAALFQGGASLLVAPEGRGAAKHLAESGRETSTRRLESTV